MHVTIDLGTPPSRGMTEKRQRRCSSSRGYTKLSSKDNSYVLDLKTIDKVSDLMLIRMLCVISILRGKCREQEAKAGCIWGQENEMWLDRGFVVTSPNS